jgi:hypothetical protein
MTQKTQETQETQDMETEAREARTDIPDLCQKMLMGVVYDDVQHPAHKGLKIRLVLPTVADMERINTMRIEMVCSELRKARVSNEQIEKLRTAKTVDLLWMDVDVLARKRAFVYFMVRDRDNTHMFSLERESSLFIGKLRDEEFNTLYGMCEAFIDRNSTLLNASAFNLKDIALIAELAAKRDYSFLAGFSSTTILRLLLETLTVVNELMHDQTQGSYSTDSPPDGSQPST